MIPRNDGGGQPKQIDTKTKNFLIGLSIAFVGGLVLSIFAFIFYHPLNTWASVAKLAFYSLPLAFGLYVMMKGFINQKIHSSPKPEIVRIYFIGSLILYPFGLLTYANAELDRSQASEYELIVSDKYVTRNKNSTSQYIRFDSPVGASCCFLPEESDSIYVNRNDFQKVVVGETKILVRIKKGFIGLPWVDSHMLKLDTAIDDSKKIAAMAWQGEPTKNENAEFREEKWPNNQQKSKEPIVQGQINGVAKYWHSNGQIYAEIPFKDGKKNGKFKLFRENGSLDQELSYKNGILHGINRWFDERGSLKQEALYINGQQAEVPQRQSAGEKSGNW